MIDTSASMQAPELATALAEVQAICRQTVGVHRDHEVVSADVSITRRQRVRDARQVTLIGGRGTDLASAITELLARHPPDVLVVVTDGFTAWPPRRPARTRVIVALVGQEVDDRTPEWTVTIRVPMEAAGDG